MVDIAANLAAVQESIAVAARGAGRDPSDVRLVAVSKRHPPSAVEVAYRAGQRHFGENYAQELAEKAEALEHLPDIVWHFIGRLQENKAKIIARHAHVAHALERAKTVRTLGRRVLGEGRPPVDILFQVSLDNEPQKGGIEPDALGALLEETRGIEGVRIVGLMAMPPLGSLDAARSTFERLARLRDAHGGERVLPELSMGMTADMDVAIACGATMVRVGTAIFGPRPE